MKRFMPSEKLADATHADAGALGLGPERGFVRLPAGGADDHVDAARGQRGRLAGTASGSVKSMATSTRP